MKAAFSFAGKPSDMPEVGFTGIAPMADGPFVTSAGAADTVAREPRAKRVE
jgi:NADH-quinone oxidoreductase subunit C